MFVFFAGGTWARACLKVLVGCVVFAAVLLRAGIAEASHFRYGTISWTVPDPVNAPRTVVFVVVAAWRSASIGSTQLTFGDATSDTTKTGATIGTGVDSIGAAYTVTQYTVSHTYASNGPFTAQYTSSARVAGLINGANGTFTVQTLVGLGGSPVNTAGPSSGSPPIIQLQQGATRTYTFPMFDGDGDPVSCRFASAAETGLPVGQEIPKVPAGGAVPVLSSVGNGCTITWNLTQAVVGQQYVMHVVMQSTHAGLVSSTAIDLITEIVTPPPPVCVGTAVFNVIAGQTVTAPTTATWGTAGNAAVTITNKPATATLSPGGSGSSPFSNTFTWTPAVADRGTSTVVIVNYTSQQNLGGACFITVNVAPCLCSGNTPVCDFATSVCTACVGDKGSPAANACPSSVNPYCAAAGACTKCTVNADCAGATHAGAFCNAAAGACVSCLADADCTSGQFCNTQTFACTAKLANAVALPTITGHTPALTGVCSAPVGASVCVSSVCDPDNKCGFANGHGPCSSSNEGTVCRTGSCSASLACRPVGGCLVDIDCTSGQFCNTATSACTAKIGNGSVVPTIAGHSPALNGTCSAAVGAAVCLAGVCDSDDRCGYANGDGPCSSSNENAVCRSASCSTALACRPAGGCLVDPDCAAGQFCNTQTSACTGQIANGAALPTIPGHAPVLDGTCTAPVGIAVCQSGICDADSKCGYADGDGSCTTLSALTLCRSGSCSVSLMCEPTGGCLVDADCLASDFCNTQTLACVPKIPNGSPLPVVAGHAPALNGACSAPVAVAVCQAAICDTDNKCGYADGDGTCTPLTALTLCRSGSCSVTLACMPAGGCLVDADCSSSTFCNTQTRACDPKITNGTALPVITGHTPALNGTCSVPVATAVCATGVCDVDAKCGYLDADGPCTIATASVCRSGACSNVGTCKPAGGCLADADCANGQFCDTVARLCAAKIANGGSLPTIGGHTPVLDGTCSPGVATAVCASAVCDNDGQCGHGTGAGPCDQLDAATVCRSGACSSSLVCRPSGGCLVDADCSAGQFCDTQSDTCSPKLANGIAMPAITGHAPPLDGSCTTAAGSAVCVSAVCDPADNACGFGNGDGTCAANDAGVVCRSGVCDVADGKCGLADGDGPCTASSVAICRSGACSVSGACQPVNGCLVDADCGAAQFCNTQTSACTPQIANGLGLPTISGHIPVLNGTCSSPVGVAVCQSGVCDIDNACGYADGAGSCTAQSATVVCRSGLCSVSLACKPDGGCVVDADCAASEFCNTQSLSCTSKLANGSPLPTIAGHTPGLDGTCSTDAATAVCQSAVCDTDNKCGYANGDGVCTPVTALTICRSGTCSVSLSCVPAGGCLVDADCTSSEFCNTQSLSCSSKIANGSALPTILGHTPNLDGSCTFAVGVAICAAGVCDPDDSCGYADTHGPCTVATSTVCRSGACSISGLCEPLGGCLGDADCVAGQFCDTSERKCAAKIANGGTLPTILGHTPVLDGTCSSTVAVAVCASGVCDTDGMCGHGTGIGPCDQLTDAAVCRSGACSVSLVCRPGEGCLVDGDCSTGQFCNTQTETCSAKVVNGISIPAITGHTPPLAGACTPEAGSVVCVSAVCDPADDACGFGNARGACTASTATTVCRSGSCDVSDGKCGLTDGHGPCTASTAAVCRSAACSVSGVCQAANGCLVDGDCTSTQFCNTQTSRCVSKLSNGTDIPTITGHAPALTATCTVDVGQAVCASGVCDTHDNACGYAKSDGPCTTLNAAFCRSGSCSVLGLCKPTNGCLVDADCGSDEFCDTESSACVGKIANGLVVPTIAGHVPPLLGTCSTDVGTAVCASGICDVADNKCGFANGNGTCTTLTAPECRSLVCDQLQCGFINGDGPCLNNAQCTSNKCDTTSQKCVVCLADSDCTLAFCDSVTGTCKPQESNGAPCTRATQCQSTTCSADGKCGKRDGDSCTLDGDCRSTQCTDGTCSAPDAGASNDGGASDSGASDTGASDTGIGESGTSDARIADTDAAESGTPDAAAGEGGTSDASDADASTKDAGAREASISDAGAPHETMFDAQQPGPASSDGAIAAIQGGGCSCSTTKPHDGDPLAALAAILVVGVAFGRRRRRRDDIDSSLGGR